MNRRSIAIIGIWLAVSTVIPSPADAFGQAITGLSVVAGETFAESIIQLHLRLPAGDSQISLLADDRPIIDRHGYRWDRVSISPDQATSYELEIPWLGTSQPDGCRLPQRLTARIDGAVVDSQSIAVVQAEARREAGDASADVYTFGSTQFDQAAAFLDTVAVTNVPWLDLNSVVLTERSGAVFVTMKTAAPVPPSSQALLDPVAGSIDARDSIKLVLLHDADCDPATGDQSTRNTEFPRAGFDTAIIASGLTTLSAAERQWSIRIETWDGGTGAWTVVPPEVASTVSLTVDNREAQFALARGSAINPDFLGPAAWRFLAYHGVPEYRQPSRLDVLPNYDQPTVKSATVSEVIVSQSTDSLPVSTYQTPQENNQSPWIWALLCIPLAVIIIVLSRRRR